MIVAHFFLRTVRRRKILFVETTSSRGVEQPSPTALELVEVHDSGRRGDWIREGYYAFTRKFPDLVLIDALNNEIRLESDHPSFDLVFRPAGLRAPDASAPASAERPPEAVLGSILTGTTKKST